MDKVFDCYCIALEHLFKILDKNCPCYSEFLALQSRLLGNIDETHSATDKEVCRLERLRIVRELNRLLIEERGVLFSGLAFSQKHEAAIDIPTIKGTDLIHEKMSAVLYSSQAFEPEMVFIPSGAFWMGSDFSEDEMASDYEQPKHKLFIPGYYLARTPITNSQYAQFAKTTGHQLPEHWSTGKPPDDKDDHPVVYVSWYDAFAYCQWLSKSTGKNYRLPTEAEWEKGARGSKKYLYPWGNWWDWARCNSGEGGPMDTTPVGVYVEGASPYGLLDMIGNVWEWTSTIFRPYPYVITDGRENLETHNDDVQRVLRGGSFSSYLSRVRTTYRLWSNPMQYCRWDVGFRVALSI